MRPSEVIEAAIFPKNDVRSKGVSEPERSAPLLRPTPSSLGSILVLSIRLCSPDIRATLLPAGSVQAGPDDARVRHLPYWLPRAHLSTSTSSNIPIISSAARRK